GLRRPVQDPLRGLDLVAVDQRMQHVLVLQHVLGGDDQTVAEPGQERHPRAGGRLDLGDSTPHPARMAVQLRQDHLAGGVPVLAGCSGGHQPAEHLVGSPADRGDGGDAQALVDLRTAGVVDAGDHVGHPEGLPHHPGGDDVRVVPAGDRSEGVRLLDTGLGEGIPVETHPGDPASLELLRQAAEGIRVLVDDRHRVPSGGQRGRQRGADPASAHDHEVHASDATRRRASPPGAGWQESPGLRGRRTPACVARDPAPRSMAACPISPTPPSGSWWAGRCAATGPATCCSPNGSRCRCSPPTRSAQWPTPRTRSCSPSPWPAPPPTWSPRGWAWRWWRSCSPWWPPTGTWCGPTRPAAATTRWPARTSARRPGWWWLRRCWWTTCSPWRCRCPPGRSTW